jgi:hypothetical protein
MDLGTPTAEMSPEDMNAALVEHAGRLGGPERIFELMKASPFNCASITDLAKDQYAPLIEAVKALK